MTHDDIMHLANETAGRDGWGCEGHLQRFAARLIAAEREACAKTVEAMVHGNVRTCAAAIRARGNDDSPSRHP